MNNKSIAAIFCCLLIISLTPAVAYEYSTNNTVKNVKTNVSTEYSSLKNIINVTKNSSYIDLNQ